MIARDEDRFHPSVPPSAHIMHPPHRSRLPDSAPHPPPPATRHAIQRTPRPARPRRRRDNLPLFRPLLLLLTATVTVTVTHGNNVTAPTIAPSASPPSAPLRQPFDPSKISTWHVGRLFSVSTTSPVATSLRNNQTARTATAPTYALIATLYDEYVRRRDEAHPKGCNLPRSHPWSIGSRNKPRVFQIGHIDDACYSFIDVAEAVQEGDLSGRVLSTAGGVLKGGREAFFDAMAGMRVPADGNWTARRYTNEPRVLRYVGQQCEVDTAQAFRVKGRFYVRVVMTNHPVLAELPDGRRHVVAEWVPQEYDDSLRMLHFNYEDRGRLENSTSLLTVYNGPMGHSTVTPTFEDQYGPLFNAYRQADVATDQAMDSVTVSNIAILALPMAMNFIPVAFIADMNTVGMVAYVIFTDIVSSIPFLVKGVELVVLSLPGKTVMTSYAVGNDTLAMVEVWLVTCRGVEKYRTIGITFIVVAVVAVIGGLALEILGLRYVARRRGRGKGDIAGGFSGSGGGVGGGGGGGGVTGPFGPVFNRWLATGWFAAKRGSGAGVAKGGVDDEEALMG